MGSTSLLAFALESIIDVISSFFVVWRFWGTWGKVRQGAEREGERETERERERTKAKTVKRERECVCVCVGVHLDVLPDL